MNWLAMLADHQNVPMRQEDERTKGLYAIDLSALEGGEEARTEE